MALVFADRVQETTSTAGTGTLSLSGAIAGYQTFVSGVGAGNTTYYTLYDSTALVWETGLGTVGAGTLSRDTVFSNSSGTTSPLTLAGNTISVWCDYVATKVVIQDPSGVAYAPDFASSNGLTFNRNTVGASVTIPTGYNAYSLGPMTVANGAIVTVSSGSIWAVN